jgi:hypothetical protein
VSSSAQPLPRLRRRSAVALTALLCLAGQVLGFAHLALVRHATCLAHDEVVHAPAASAATAAHERAESARGRADAYPIEDGDGHEDDHCLVVASRRRELAPLDSAASAAIVAAPAPVASLHGVSQEPAPPVPLLFLAPKSSPPASAV